MTKYERRSLLSFICPRLLSFGTVDGFRLSLVSRNLLSEFEACDTRVAPGNELMKVYLRLKPFIQTGRDLSAEPAVLCVDNYTVTARPPESRMMGIRESKRTNHNFTFSKVFDSAVNQSSVFSTVALDQIRSFLDGMNGLIFTYGTTGSGKTYTMQGCPRDMGLIPRALCTLFRSVKHSMNPSLLPKDFSDVTTLNPQEVEKLLRNKATLLKLGCNLLEDDFNVNSFDQSIPEVTIFGPNTNDMSGATPCTFPSGSSTNEHRSASDLRFTFWLSFAEIYNELIYDLLDPSQCVAVTQLRGHVQQKNIFSTVSGPGICELSSNQIKKKSLELRTDKNGNVFIKGLNVFPLSTPEEALRLILVGRQFQRVAATRLNQASSRSHTILTIKAVRVVDKENPKFARISSLTFCDLAGSERSERAATGGQTVRLREAGTINTSLLTLGRCIECLRYNQSHPENPRLVPYRDSKLTRLFQSFFTGRGKACMVVNVSPNPELFDETLHALRFSALATRIIVHSNTVVDTFVQSSSDNASVSADKHESQHHSSSAVDLSPRPLENSAITETPPTVVPNAALVRPRQPSSPNAQPQLFSATAESMLLDETKVEPSIGSDTTLCTSKTPPNTDESTIEWEQFTKQELISIVKELSEQLFDSKAELVEQEARLRSEMCEAINRQLVEFERLYEESWNAQEKLFFLRSNRRMKQLDETVTDHSNGLSQKRKRLRQDYAVDSSDEDSSMDENYSPHSDDVAIENNHSESLSEFRERIHDLEGELADQRDAIELLSKERDQLRMEVTRLEFAKVQAQNVLDTSRMGMSQKATKIAAVQTEFSTLSYDHHQLDQLDLNAQTQGMKGENQQLPAYFAGVNGVVQEILQDKHEVESKSAHFRSTLIPRESEFVRPSEDLQSFLANESRLQHMVTIEQLQQHIYDLEEQFAKKHDALTHTELAYQQAMKENEVLTQRVFTQIEELNKVRRELAESSANHQAALHAAEVNSIADRECALQALKDELEGELRIQQDLVAELKARIPERHASVQTTFLPSSIDSFVQTSLLETQLLDNSVQVSFPGTSVGSQTECLSVFEGNSPSLVEDFDRASVQQDRLEASNPDPERTVQNVMATSHHQKRRLCLRNRNPGSRNLRKLPSPVPPPQCISDSDSESEKENYSGSSTGKEDAQRSASEPIHPIKTRSVSRRTRSTFKGDYIHKSTKPSAKIRPTRSATATRRLPPLAESTQILVDSFLQDDLDAALAQLDLEYEAINDHRRLRPLTRQPTRKRH